MDTHTRDRETKDGQNKNNVMTRKLYGGDANYWAKLYAELIMLYSLTRLVGHLLLDRLNESQVFDDFCNEIGSACIPSNVFGSHL